MPDRRSRVFIFMRKLHKWLGLVIGLQLLVWLGSGLIMSLLDQGIAGGFSSRAESGEPKPLGEYGELYSTIALPLAGKNIVQLQLKSLMDAPVYRVKLADGVVLYDALSGAQIIIDSERAIDIAQASYAGEGRLVAHHFFLEGSDTLKDSHGPVWRMDFDDPLQTWVFIDGDDGRVIKHHNDRSGLMDTLLMLHFMDYLQEDSFNNPQIIVVGFSALWMSISGFFLLLVSFNRRDFSWLRRT